MAVKKYISPAGKAEMAFLPGICISSEFLQENEPVRPSCYLQ